MGINVLSLFDGMSCGQIALNRAGVPYATYYASEIDKHSIAVTQKQYPSTVQLGDVTKVKAKNLPQIDLLLGGSPCQGFSFAGSKLNFNDPRSQLFFEFVRLLKECKPKYFLFENVKMEKMHVDVITNYLGCEPVLIDSNRFSAQSRARLYWTNIPLGELPADKGILLGDIVESGGVLRDKSQTVLTTLFKENAKSMLKRNKQGLLVAEGLPRGVYTLGLTKPGVKARKSKNVSTSLGEIKAVAPETYSLNGSPVVFRKFTPLECERLQTVPESYTASASMTQRYRMLGNGWTVDVIAYLLSGLTK